MRSIAKCDIMFASSGGFISMKTKIIYISGNEVFDMADIRAAFEEVRSTLGLGRDTIMFGVPVDNDDALLTTNTVQAQTLDKSIEKENSISVQEPIENIEQAEKIVEPEIIEKNTKKVSTRKTRTHVKEEKHIQEETDSDQEKNKSDEKIIPILSILAAQKDSDNISDDSQKTETKVVEPEIIQPVDADTDKENISDIDISAEFVTSDESDNNEHHSVIADMIADEAPEAPIEKTLEQLLESMAPLREDVTEEPVDEEINTEEDVSIDTSSEDSDATLEQLAAEFAENQDKIPDLPKSENHSKIGKLKNILPFKKAKRDETGLMGDLFGWAGIAANDDDFAIPGFFTNAASKK